MEIVIDIDNEILYYCINTVIQSGGEHLSWQFDPSVAVFLQIAEKLKEDILCGKYPPDSQIPSVRQLAFDASVNPNTVQKALAALESEGLIFTKGTMGKFVTDNQEVLCRARNQKIEHLISSFLKDAASLGISYDELLTYIKEVIVKK